MTIQLGRCVVLGHPVSPIFAKANPWGHLKIHSIENRHNPTNFTEAPCVLIVLQMTKGLSKAVYISDAYSSIAHELESYQRSYLSR